MSPADCPLGACDTCRVCPLALLANRVRFVPDAAATYDAKARMVREARR